MRQSGFTLLELLFVVSGLSLITLAVFSAIAYFVVKVIR